MKTVKAVVNFFEARSGLSKRSREQYEESLAYLQREHPDLSAKPDQLRRSLNQLSTAWVRDAYWRIWKSFFRWSHLEYDIKDPMERVERNKPPDVEMKFLDPQELALFMAAADSLYDQSICVLALDAGIRASEFGRIRIQDVGTDTIWVQGKGNKQCRVPISPDTHYILDRLIASNLKRSPQSLLFPGIDGKAVSRFTVYRIVRGCMDKAGIAGPKRGPHCLRHSLGSNYIADGGDLVSLQRIMRHNNITTTRRYVNLRLQTVIEQHNIHSPLKNALRGAQGVLLINDVMQEAEEIVRK